MLKLDGERGPRAAGSEIAGLASIRELIGSELGIWRTVLADLVERSWPDEIVLIPRLGGRKARREEELRALERLRQIGPFEDDGAPPER
jgi:hypothetical protein